MNIKGSESENAGQDDNIGRDDLGNFPAPQPAPQQPATVRPVMAQPIMAQPIMAQQVMIQPVAAQPVMAQPVMAQSVMAQPVMAQPTMPQPANGFSFEEEQTRYARFIDWLPFNKKKGLTFIAAPLLVVIYIFLVHPAIFDRPTDDLKVLASRLGGSWVINEKNFQGKMIFKPSKDYTGVGDFIFYDNSGTQINKDSYIVSERGQNYLELTFYESNEETFQVTFKSKDKIAVVINGAIPLELTRDD